MSKTEGSSRSFRMPAFMATVQDGETLVRARVEVPARTIVSVALGIFAVWLLVRLWSVLLLVVLALLLTAALDPVVSRLERRGWTRTRAVSALIVAMLALFALLLLLIVPPIVREGRDLSTNLPTYLAQAKPYFKGHMDSYNKMERAVTERANDPSLYLSHARGIGLGLTNALTQGLLLVTMTAYLLIADGERTLFWLFRYLPAQQRTKVRRSLPEISRVVSEYVLGQLITSLLFGVFAIVLCLALGVPQAILLAILAFIADAIPIVGALIATVPAVLLALTVSPTVGGIVLVAYVLYQQIENHFIVPRVYNNALQISPFGVLLAVAIGAQLLGVIGALIALPIAAAIPAIERIWRETLPTAPDPTDLGLAPAPWETDPAAAAALPPPSDPQAESASSVPAPQPV